ncbi:RDD family protein [Streptomyces sp. RFCAC02]|uniref:RDD family protein n=1 Tax=Streptomyces sp. RFCAC02 TaxID=2499143 RepID=UPI001021762F|nr:RDD family protein [Streptomyces sp. RFCAC02]
MSSPPAGQAGGGPGPNWYPDPSIPGYIRYWNGTSWVPGSSRPEPRAGEPVPTPPTGSAQPAPGPVTDAPKHETQPFFFDEDEDRPSGGSGAQEPRIPGQASGSALPELRGRGEVTPAGGQGAGWGSDEDVSASPSASRGPGAGDPRGPLGGSPAGGSPVVPEPQATPEPAQEPKTAMLRRLDTPDPSWERQVHDLARQAPGTPPQGAPNPPAQQQPPVAQQHAAPPQPPVQASPPQGVPAQTPPGYGYPHPGAQQRPTPPGGYGYPQAGAPAAPVGGYGYPHAGQGVPGQQVPGQVGHAQSPFLQSHEGAPLTMARRLVDPGRPYPAGLGRRLTGRVVDVLLPLAAAAGVAWPLAGSARDHIQEQIDAAERAGVTKQIWLIDGTTALYAGMVLGVFLVVGVLLEALPTALWGTTPGKGVAGTRVLDMERQEKPTFGRALLRWLVWTATSLTVVLALVSMIVGARDRPWRQAWHDKAGRTFVAGRKNRPSESPG